MGNRKTWAMLLGMLAGIAGISQGAEARSYYVGGTVTGLQGGGLILQNNGRDNIAIAPTNPPGGNVTFRFPTRIATGATYRVTVLTAPSNPTQICTVTNGNGVMGRANVTNVMVNCVTASYTVGGAVSGLVGTGLTLRNGADTLAIAANGAFAFPTRVLSGGTYAVNVVTQPSGPAQTCTVTNGSGTVTNANVSVSVSCTTTATAYSIGGTVSGLSGSGLTLRNGSDMLTIAANGAFTFPTLVLNGNTYMVSVSAQPTNPAQTCIVANSSGTVANANVTNIAVSCATNAYSIGGTVNGLAGSGLSLRNGADTLAIAANGTFTFPSYVLSGGTYAVSVATQPTNQTCSVANGNGTVTASNITNVAVACTSPASLSLLAGDLGGAGSIDGMALDARFNHDTGVAFDPVSGAIFVADRGNHTIRKIMPWGEVVTFAGAAGQAGTLDGPAPMARFNSPQGIAIDRTGFIYVADTGNHTIRRISPDGQVMTFAGTPGLAGFADGYGVTAQFRWPEALTVDSVGNVYVADTYNHTVRMINPGGNVTTLAGTPGLAGYGDGPTFAARFNFPSGIASDNQGIVYVADTFNHVIRRIDPFSGNVITLAGNPNVAGSLDGWNTSALFNLPQGITADHFGNLFVADTANHTLRSIRPDGMVTTFSGWAGAAGANDGPASAARYSSPQGLTTDLNGIVYAADAGNNIVRKVMQDGFALTLAGSAGQAGSSDGAGAAARFSHPEGIGTDAAGNVFVVDSNNNTVRRIDPTGNVTTLAGMAGVMGSADGIGNGASFNHPVGSATDGAGNSYIADAANHVIRKVTAAGVVTTLAGAAGFVGAADGPRNVARFNNPQAVAVDAIGNVYVADTGNNTIRKITPIGDVTTLAGMPGISGSADGTNGVATFFCPRGLAIDTNNNLYVADTCNNAIRKITPTGMVTTFAGTAGQIGSLDGGGTAARFNTPIGLATDTNGNVYVADSGNSTLRKITPAAVTTTIAGTVGTVGFTPGALPGVITNPQYLAIIGRTLYFTQGNGVAMITGLP